MTSLRVSPHPTPPRRRRRRQDFVPRIHVTPSDFASITDNGALCDGRGQLGPAEFEAVMRRQIRHLAQARLALDADAGGARTPDEAEFMQFGTLKLMFMEQTRAEAELREVRAGLRAILRRLDPAAAPPAPAKAEDVHDVADGGPEPRGGGSSVQNDSDVTASESDVSTSESAAEGPQDSSACPQRVPAPGPGSKGGSHDSDSEGGLDKSLQALPSAAEVGGACGRRADIPAAADGGVLERSSSGGLAWLYRRSLAVAAAPRMPAIIQAPGSPAGIKGEPLGGSRGDSDGGAGEGGSCKDGGACSEPAQASEWQAVGDGHPWQGRWPSTGLSESSTREEERDAPAARAPPGAVMLPRHDSKDVTETRIVSRMRPRDAADPSPPTGASHQPSDAAAGSGSGDRLRVRGDSDDDYMRAHSSGASGHARPVRTTPAAPSPCRGLHGILRTRAAAQAVAAGRPGPNRPPEQPQYSRRGGSGAGDAYSDVADNSYMPWPPDVGAGVSESFECDSDFSNHWHDLGEAVRVSSPTWPRRVLWKPPSSVPVAGAGCGQGPGSTAAPVVAVTPSGGEEQELLPWPCNSESG